MVDMKRKTVISICLTIIASLLLSVSASAWAGDSGYEGGISSGYAPGKTSYEYQEMCFITGEPVLLKGTVVIKKSLKDNLLSVVYTYNLKNTDKGFTLTRTLNYATTLTKKDNGQTIEETTLSKPASETIRTGSVTYTLKSYDFSRSCIVDSKPSINYYAGNLWGKKIYQAGAAGQGISATVTVSGEFYGYDQYWGTTEVESLKYVVESDSGRGDEADNWGGTVSVTLSSSTSKKLVYSENQPDQISFEGGFVQSQMNSSILEYTSTLPEFDSNGRSTDKLVTKSGSLKLETFPVQTRLPVPNLGHLRGHWAENDISTLFSLEIFTHNQSTFKPENYITRAEFTDALVKAAKTVPTDPALVSRTTAVRRSTAARNSKTAAVSVSPFSDVSVSSTYYSSIEDAYKRGLTSGVGGSSFKPDQGMLKADAIVLFIKALGLEVMAPNPQPLTAFRDDKQIPSYARSAVYVAQQIGLVTGDGKGNLNPNSYLTKAEAAALINRFINYMRDDIRADYMERMVNYQ